MTFCVYLIWKFYGVDLWICSFLTTSQFLGEFLSLSYVQGPANKKKKKIRSAPLN